MYGRLTQAKECFPRQARATPSRSHNCPEQPAAQKDDTCSYHTISSTWSTGSQLGRLQTQVLQAARSLSSRPRMRHRSPRRRG